jgi:hypothetical protein
MMCAACQTSGAPPSRPFLPAAPSTFGQPVPVPKPVKGEDARVFAAKTRGALIDANGRLASDAAFYADVRGNFSK